GKDGYSDCTRQSAPEDKDKRILVLCYNKLLASHLASSLKAHPNVTALHFHAWAGQRNGVRWTEGETDEAFAERLLTHLRDRIGDYGRFDAVLIDEAQDWPKIWFECAKLALREPETGDLLIVGDGNQALYRRRVFSWKDAGIHAQGRTTNLTR